MRSSRTTETILLTALAFTSLSSAFEVPVIVQEPAGIARTAEPVSGGIPLPPAMFRPGDLTLGLFDGPDPVPLQTSELVVGPKGFVRWVLLDFQLDLKPNERRTLTLKTATPKPPPRAIEITRTDGAVHIDTGSVAFTASGKKPFALLRDITVAGRPVAAPALISYIDGFDGAEYRADSPDLLTLHYAGPLRLTVEIRGTFKDDNAGRLRYCTYVTAWAGRSDILVSHSLINSRPDQRYLAKIKGSRIELKPVNPSETILIGADKPLTFPSGRELSLHQGLTEQTDAESPPAVLTHGPRTAWSGAHAAGWIASGPISVADRLFRTDPPRSLTVRPDGTIILDAAPTMFEGSPAGGSIRGRPYAQQDQYRWLYDCSHLSSEYRIDFKSADDPDQLNAAARAAAARIWAVAPAEWYSQCRVLAVAAFGTLADEIACHAKWAWTAADPPQRRPNPTRFVAWEDNHYESEADSAEAMLLMYLRNTQRGFFDEAEAWVRYQTDLQAWRTEDWLWKDGGIWWPQGGPPGNRPVRAKANRDFASWNKGTDADRTLWRLAMAKGCYCHFYGAGLVDWFCLTGDLEALRAAIDNCETKLDEFTHYRQFVPGKSPLGSTRGFGRGFYVAVRTWMVRPQNPVLQQLVTLCRDTFVNLPEQFLDERGVYAVVADKYPETYITPPIKNFMAENGITVDNSGTFRNAAGETWKWKDIGGTWMIAYIQSACNLLAEQTGDEDMMDYTIAAGQFTARFMLSPVARQTWYYTALDIPRKGEIWDEWKYDGQQRNEFGEGPRTSGWYTRFFPDCCARAYSWTGEPFLLERAKEFWSFGNRRRYQSRQLTEKHAFANHVPPKDDSVLSTARLFYESAHPRDDSDPPAPVRDLEVRRLDDRTAAVVFTSPADRPGPVVRYQVKVSTLPIVAYEDWDYCADSGRKQNWWKAVNCTKEPTPGPPGQKESFIVANLPDTADGPLFFAVRSFDAAGNRSPISNLFKVDSP